MAALQTLHDFACGEGAPAREDGAGAVWRLYRAFEQVGRPALAARRIDHAVNKSGVDKAACNARWRRRMMSSCASSEGGVFRPGGGAMRSRTARGGVRKHKLEARARREKCGDDKRQKGGRALEDAGRSGRNKRGTRLEVKCVIRVSRFCMWLKRRECCSGGRIAVGETRVV